MSSVNYVLAALPPRATPSNSANKNIFDVLNESGIQYNYQNDSQSTNDNSSNAKNPFTHLWGVY
jgi:hypothetical protein